MSELVEIFGDKVELENGGHVDFLLQDMGGEQPETPLTGQKSAAFPRTTYRDPKRHNTYQPPHYQTVEGKPDSIGRNRCRVLGRPFPCDAMAARGLSGIASLKRIKSLRAKYRKSE